MRETYSDTITEIDELGGAAHSAASSTYVCDRCGFAYPKKSLAFIDGLELCSKCIDEDQEK